MTHANASRLDKLGWVVALPWPKSWMCNWGLTCNTWHPEGFMTTELPFMSQASSHLSSLQQLQRSSWKMFASEMLLIQRYMAVSSAKSLTPDLTCSGRSFMYARNKMGPRTEPCGTPEETGIVPEWKQLVSTVCFLLSKSFWPILKCLLWYHKDDVFGVIFHVCLYQILKSSKIKSVCFLDCIFLEGSSIYMINWVSQDRFFRNPCCRSWGHHLFQ